MTGKDALTSKPQQGFDAGKSAVTPEPAPNAGEQNRLTQLPATAVRTISGPHAGLADRKRTPGKS